MRNTLLLLSKLYRCVDARTFAGLAQDAVAAATSSVQGAAKVVLAKSGPLDGQLFVIRHLLFLREQIAPFQVDFAVMDVDLDFTHMRDHIRRIMTGGGCSRLRRGEGGACTGEARVRGRAMLCNANPGMLH